MKREDEIKQAAENCVTSVCKDCFVIRLYHECNKKCIGYYEQANGFTKGAKWADTHPKNVWHKASEEPENLTQIVCVCNMFGSKQVCSFRVDKGNPIEWKHIVKFRHLEKWAYFNELIED